MNEQPAVHFAFTPLEFSKLYWCVKYVQFISMYGHLQLVQITPSTAFNLFRAADEWICDANSLRSREVHEKDTSINHFQWRMHTCGAHIWNQTKKIYAPIVRIKLKCSLLKSGCSSPLTLIVTCSLVAPMLFLTSHTKVVLTELSTFNTLSSFSLICTVSGISPVILWGNEQINVGKKRKKQWGEAEMKICIWAECAALSSLNKFH